MGHTLCNGEMPWNKPLHFNSYSSFSFTFILPRATPLNASPNLHSGQVFVDNKHEGVAYKQEGALLHRSNSAPAQQGCRRNSEDLNQRCAPAELGLRAGAGARRGAEFLAFSVAQFGAVPALLGDFRVLSPSDCTSHLQQHKPDSSGGVGRAGSGCGVRAGLSLWEQQQEQLQWPQGLK